MRRYGRASTARPPTKATVGTRSRVRVRVPTVAAASSVVRFRLPLAEFKSCTPTPAATMLTL